MARQSKGTHIERLLGALQAVPQAALPRPSGVVIADDLDAEALLAEAVIIRPAVRARERANGNED